MFGRKKLLARIKELEDRLTDLENMHAREYDMASWEKPCITIHRGLDWQNDFSKIRVYRDRQLTYEEFCEHPQPKQVDYKRITNIPTSAVDTDRIPKVTLGELARLVIDGTPIKRQEKISAKRISEYTEDSTTTITVTE
jgi:hypothetical protein